MEITLRNVVFDGTANPRAKYTIDLDGTKLFDGVGMRRETVPRPTAHGVFSSRGYREARSIPIRGLINSTSLFDQQNDMALLASLLADGSQDWLYFQPDMESLRIRVELASEPLFEVLVPGRVARFQLMFRAPDPRLLGEVREFTGSSVNVYHLGTFPAIPEITVAGPRTAPYTITGPGGKQIIVSKSLSAGQSHTLDFLNGGVKRNGVRELDAVTRWEPFEIQPGVHQTISISAGSMTVKLANTY